MQEWEEFADEFIRQYLDGTKDQQLELLRLLSTKWRHNEVMQLIAPRLS